MSDEPRQIFNYQQPQSGGFSIFETDGKVIVTVISAPEHGSVMSGLALPREQLVRLMYALRTERSKTVTAELVAARDEKPKP